MNLAAELQDYLDAQASRNAARNSQRLARDAFIQTQFPLLNALLLDLIAAASGQHALLAIAATPMVESVTGRSFSTLNKTAISVTATLDGTAQTVAFTPRLEFREEGQFGAVDCTLDFSYAPRRSRRDALAAGLLTNGVQMKGTTSAFLMWPSADGLIEASVGLFENALAAFLLRG